MAKVIDGRIKSLPITNCYHKYLCIKCLDDDRINDAKLVSIDQCAFCPRYEPVYGQTYEVQEDIDNNSAAILDDAQMGYSSVDDYMTLKSQDKFFEGLTRASVVFDNSAINSPSTQSETKSSTMDWNYAAKENQKPNISWRQNSRYDDSARLNHLNSYHYEVEKFDE